MNECKPLNDDDGDDDDDDSKKCRGGRGLHWSTFRLNLSAFCGIGVHLGVV